MFIREKVWFEKSLSQSDGLGMKRGVSEYRNGLWWGKTPSGDQYYVCTGETALCRSEEGEQWDGKDQTILFQVSNMLKKGDTIVK
jgi:hypothetical protein